MNIPKLRFKGFNDEWKEEKIGNIATVVSGGTPSTNNIEYWNGNINWFVPSEIINKKYVDNSKRKITDKGLKNSSAKLLPVNAILFTSRATIGSMAILKQEATTNQGFQSLIINNNNDVNFIYSMQDLIAKKANNKAAGSTFLEISNKSVKSIKLFIPNLPEQQKIGALFAKLDNLINLQAKKLELLKQLKQGLLQKLFPQNNQTTPQLRFKGFNDKWESKKLNTIFNFYKGRELGIQQLHGTKYPAIIYGELYTKYHEIINVVFSKSDSKGFLGYKNDLLFPGSSTVVNGTAQANALMVNNVQLGGDIIIARPKQFNIDSSFMSYQINSQKNKLYPIIVGTTITHMYGKDLSKLQFMITNLEEQQKISSLLTNLDKLLTKTQEKITLFKQVKKYLLQQMFI